MRWVNAILLSLLVALLALPAAAEPRSHTVGKGQTLGRIAKRYNVSIEAICNANRIGRRDPIKPGQKLIIPDKDDEDGKKAAARRRQSPKPEEAKAERADARAEPKERHPGGLHTLNVPGAPDAYYYTPTGPGRKALKPVLFYLHGRGGHPASDCQRWAPIARRIGWLVCPTGPEDRGAGARGWNNNWAQGRQVVLATLNALRAKYGRRVQLYGNTLIGFSEGAYVAMNVGVREPRTFNRWLILAADSDYWGGMGTQELGKNRNTLRRVYLITGEQDGAIKGTDQVRRWLKSAGVATRVSTPKDMGHEVPLTRKASMYRAALLWLDRGTVSGTRSKTVAKRSKASSRKR